jgi:hypothetical protein
MLRPRKMEVSSFVGKSDLDDAGAFCLARNGKELVVGVGGVLEGPAC